MLTVSSTTLKNNATLSLKYFCMRCYVIFSNQCLFKWVGAFAHLEIIYPLDDQGHTFFRSRINKYTYVSHRA